jgi:tRNA-uridine 2-sulfurtransferase
MIQPKRQQTVVVGMSGGVDSSLTAALLKEQGYFVIGVYMKNWSEPIKGVEHCPWVQDQLDARRVAHQLNIPFYTVNFEKEYKKQVIDSFFTDYSAGRTPNPDVLCNKFIKFDAFYKYANKLGANYIATGHYAQIIDHKLYKGRDPKKDQSYFLWAINPTILPHVLFPLGELTKEQVRIEAQKRGLATAHKKDSQGICFIGQADVRQFLAGHFASNRAFKPGKVLNLAGEVVGKHQGAGYYTLGQRAGISDIAWEDNQNRPILYVIATDTINNILTIGEEADLYASRLTASQNSWLGDLPQVGEPLLAKIRYGQTDTPCVMLGQDESQFTIAFGEPQRAITPGQSIVLYRGDQMLGGGIIEQSLSAATSLEQVQKAEIRA